MPPSSYTAAAVLCGAAMLAAPAHAGQEDTRRFFRLTEEAQERFEQERYDDALRLFEEAFMIRADPVVRFNIAVCLDRLERVGEARQRYLEVESNKDSDPRMRVYAIKRAAEIEKARLLAARLKAERERREALERAKVRVPPAPQPPIAAWTLTGVGALGLVTGGVLWGLASGEKDALVNAPRFEQRRLHQGRARDLALAGDICALTGLVAAGVGVGLWWARSSVVVSPAVRPQELGVKVSLSF